MHLFLVTKPEVESLLRMFKKYVPNSANLGHTHHSSRMDRTKFRDVLHNSFDMTDDMLMDRSKLRQLMIKYTFMFKILNVMLMISTQTTMFF